MVKKCIICSQPAQFCVKGSSECYCTPCAQDQFGDVSCLIAVEEAAKAVKQVVDDQLGELGFTEKDSNI